jgi:hypothetical protein
MESHYAYSLSGFRRPLGSVKLVDFLGNVAVVKHTRQAYAFEGQQAAGLAAGQAAGLAAGQQQSSADAVAGQVDQGAGGSSDGQGGLWQHEAAATALAAGAVDPLVLLLLAGLAGCVGWLSRKGVRA